MRIALNVLQQGSVSEGPEWWRLLDDAGVHVIGLPDSPALVRELYVVSAMCAASTSQATIMTCVTNPLSRDPAVTASALLTLEELAPGRISMGIGTGDSAMWGVGVRPARVARLREYILAVKALVRGEAATYGGRTFRMPEPSMPLECPMLQRLFACCQGYPLPTCRHILSDAQCSSACSRAHAKSTNSSAERTANSPAWMISSRNSSK